MLFGFAHCPDVCPTSLQKLTLLKQSEPELKNVRVVMISVDAERDTRAGAQGIPAVTSPASSSGSPAIHSAFTRSRRQFSAAFFKGDVEPDQRETTSVGHSGQVFAIDKAGNLRAEFYDASLEAMAGVTRALLAE